MKKKLNFEELQKYTAMGPHQKGGFLEEIGMGTLPPPVNLPITKENIIKVFEDLMDWEYNKKKDDK